LKQTNKKWNRLKKICLLALLIWNSRQLYAQNPLQQAPLPVNLTCEYARNPLGIDNEFPKLSWNIRTNERNWKQSAYQIIVSSDSTGLAKDRGNIWNSGKVISNENIHIKYQGIPLKSFMNCWWKVRVWNSRGEASSWSKPAYWKMGVLSDKDWKGKWIASDLKLKDYQIGLRELPDFDMGAETGIWERADSIRKHVKIPDSAPAVYIRKQFKLKKKIKRATAYICGLGLNELYMNGKRVGKEYLNPAYTDYQKRILYNTYDVTDNVKRGVNAVGVILGNGWYNLIVPHALRYYTADYIAPPKLLMQLYIEYTDGSSTIISTDSSWKYTTNGPIVFNDILGGETYDARKEMPGWSGYGYTDSAWKNCISADPPEGMLRSQQLYPVRKLDSFPAVKIEKTDKGYRFDLGRAICGWVKIKLKGERGQKVKVYYIGAGSHTLGRYQTDCFILKGNGKEVFEPRFSYNGFQYIDVEGIDYTPSVSDVTGVLVNTDMKPIGEFSCSNEKFNEIQSILINTLYNYIIHIPNDPTREKSGWTQDIESGFDVNAYNFDVANMYIKWQHDFNDIVHKNGYVPPVVPGRFDGPTINGPWWGGMIVYNVIKLYEYYHDADIVKNSYDAMKKYVGYLTSISKDHIVEWGLGDWMEPFRADPGGRPTTTPIPLTSTIAYYYYVDNMAAFAKMLHKDTDARYFKKLAAEIKQSYNRHFLDEHNGQYAQGSQAAQLMSLHFGLVPDHERELAIQKLKESIIKRNGHLSTGFVATPVLLTTLCDLGLEKEAYAMTTKEDFPGWFDMIFKKGNSVMKENWEGGLVQMPSLAGPIGYWFYYSLAGIQPFSEMTGFKKIVIKPDYSDSLHWVSASYNSLYGKITVEWKKHDGRCSLHVGIPANTSALVYLPATDPGNVLEGNRKISAHQDIHIKEITNKNVIIRIGSGSYDFTIHSKEKQVSS